MFRLSGSLGSQMLIASLTLSVTGCGGGTAPERAEVSTAPPASGSLSSSGPTDAASSSPAPEPSTCADGELPAVAMFDVATGDVSWMACSAAERWRSILGATDEVVLVSEAVDYSDADTVAFSAADGDELWRQPTTAAVGDIPIGPVAGDGVVVRVGGSGTGLVGYDVLTGDEDWRVDDPIQLLGQTDTIAVVADTAPAQTSTVVVATGPPAGTDPIGAMPPLGIRGLDRATGAEVWSSDVGFGDMSGVGVARGPAAVWDDTIAVPTDSTLTALDVATGATLWTAPRTDHPDAADGVVVGAMPGRDPDRSIRALDGGTGATLWEAPGASSYGDLLAVGDGIVCVLTDDRTEVVAYELRTGNERWRAPAERLGQPQLIVDTTLISLWEGTLSALSTADGSILWTTDQPLGTPLMSNVGAIGPSLYVAVNSRAWGD